MKGTNCRAEFAVSGINCLFESAEVRISCRAVFAEAGISQFQAEFVELAAFGTIRLQAESAEMETNYFAALLAEKSPLLKRSLVIKD